MQKDDQTKIVGLVYMVLGILYTISYKLNAIGVSTEAISPSPVLLGVDFIMKFGIGYGLMVYGLYKAFMSKRE